MAGAARPQDIAGAMAQDDDFRHETTVGAVMRPADDVVHIDHALDEALTLMKALDEPFLPVVDGDEVVGSLSAQRIRSRIHDTGERESASVRDVVQTKVLYCYVDDTLAAARAVMDEAGAGHIFVLDRDGTLRGIVVLDDLIARGAAREARTGRRHDTEASPDSRAATGGRTKSGAPNGRPASYAPRPTLRPKRGLKPKS